MEICAHMEVVDANDQHIGTVESIEGDRIKMFEKDALDPKELFIEQESGGRSRYQQGEAVTKGIGHYNASLPVTGTR